MRYLAAKLKNGPDLQEEEKGEREKRNQNTSKGPESCRLRDIKCI
jgi:hypothetical protein